VLTERLQSREISTNLIEINSIRPFLTRPFADDNTVVFCYDVMKETKYLVVLYANVVITEWRNDVVESEDLICTTEYLTL